MVGAATADRDHERLEHLYEISKLLVAFESVDRTVSAAVALAARTLAIRTTILVEQTEGRTSMVAWNANGRPDDSARVAQAHALHAYAYLVGAPSSEGVDVSDVTSRALPGLSPADREPADDSRFIVIPLVVGRGSIFGVLQLEGASRLDRQDLMFVNAIANQLAIALDRHRAWRRDISEREHAVRERIGAEARESTAEWRRLTAEALMERHEALVDNLDHAFVWEADAPSLRLLYVSARGEKLLGYPRLQWLSEPDFWVSHVFSEDRDTVRATVDKLLAEKTDQRCNHRCVALDGRIVWLDTGMHLARADTTTPTIQAVSVDVTPAKHAEEQIREQLSFTRALAASLGEGVLAVDRESRVTFVNRAAEELLGLADRDALGRPLEDVASFVAPDGRSAGSPLARVMRTRRSARSEEHILVRQDGKSFPVSYTSAPIRRAGSIMGAIVTFQDIADRKQAQQALYQAIRLREEILAIVSHDLRNPLSSILMSALVLLRSGPEQERRRAHRNKVEMIERSARRMARLIDDLADLASIQAGRLDIKRETQDPAPLVQEAVMSFEEMALERGLTLRGDLGGGLVPVSCDRDRVLQVFSNLIGNAVKVTAEGGSLVVRAEGREGEVLFSVSDTGPGIPKVELDRIFERYWRGETPSYRGTGLGLTIAKGIVSAHGGRIWAESTVGVGSTFFFTIPATDSALDKLGRGGERASGPTKSERPAAPVEARPVLIVEDEPDIREAMTAVLEGAGVPVITAANGSEALHRLHEAGPRPCLILLDLTMPVMDGWSFMAVRDKDPELADIPVVVISGTHELRAATASLNVAASFRKPLEAEALIDMVHRHSDPEPPPGRAVAAR